MRCEITSEKVLEAASKCPFSKQTLEVLFPEVFENKKPFCVVNDVLSFKGATQSLFQVVESGDSSLIIRNLTRDVNWCNKVPRSYKFGCGSVNKFVTREEMVKLLNGSNTSLDDITIIRAIDFQNKLTKIE